MKKYLLLLISCLSFLFNLNVCASCVNPDSIIDKSIKAYTITVNGNSSKGIPIQVNTSGKLTLTGTIDKIENGKFSFSLYKDKDFTEPVSNKYLYFDTKSNSLKDKIVYYLDSKNVYYLKLDNNSQDDVVSHFALQFCGDKSINLSKGKTYVRSTSEHSKNVYHRFIIKNSGYASVTVKSMDNSNTEFFLALCDKQKKEISNNVIASQKDNTNQVVFAVKPGTYYVRVRVSNVLPSDYYTIRYNSKGVKDISSSSKSKAPSVKLDKTIDGIILHSDNYKKPDYYKMVLKKKTKVKISSNAYSTGPFYIKVYNKNGKIVGNPLKQYVSLDKGIYYISVYKGTRRSGGYYRFKVNTR